MFRDRRRGLTDAKPARRGLPHHDALVFIATDQLDGDLDDIQGGCRFNLLAQLTTLFCLGISVGKRFIKFDGLQD